jgi:hypothetical protein
MSAAAYALLGVALGFVGQYALAYRREHAERRLAHDARVYASRSALYPELLRARHRQLVTVERTYPTASASPQPTPDPVSLDDAIDLGANADAFNSPAVAEADRLLGKAITEFSYQVASYEQQHWRRTSEPGISQDHYPAVEEKRIAIRALYQTLAATVRLELVKSP